MLSRWEGREGEGGGVKRKGGGFFDGKSFSTSTGFEHLRSLVMKEGKLPRVKILSVSIHGWIMVE